MNLFMQQFKQPLLALVILRIPTHTGTATVVWCGVAWCGCGVVSVVFTVQEMIVEVFNEVQKSIIFSLFYTDVVDGT